MSIMVRSEEDGSILLESKIQPHTAYQKQQETLIVWSEGDNYDLALSFQEKVGCDEIWEKICQEDDKFLADMFLQLMDEDTLEERRKQLMNFLKELVSFSIHLQLHQKDDFFKALAHHGLLLAMEMLLVSDSEENRLSAVEMFSQIVDISPYLVRDFIMKEGQTQEEDMLINHIIDYMICDGDTGNAYQLSQLVRTLLDPENMALGANKMEKSEFLSFFYKHSMHVMTAPLFAATCDDRPSKDDYVNSVTLGHIVELLTFCVEHHTYHIKNYIISKDLLRRVLVLMKSQHKFLVLNSLRFLRRIVGLKDEFYNRYIVKGQLFDAVITAFKENGQRYNLLNSAIVELFEFIRVEDMKSLCSHVCANYTPFFKEVTYVSTFKGILQRDEQEQDRKQQNNRILDSRANMNHGIIHVNSRFRRDVRTLEEEEELWFEQEGEENGEENGEETVTSEQTDLLNDDSAFKSRKTFVNEKPPPSIVNNKRPLVGLVDYPDDEEEEDDEGETTSPAKRARLNAS
ncbi:SMEK 2, suppressor of mek1 (Dictyostelium) [Desmophyllum pertusum]|uniref:SMEK 2, suppressor of mek1 (Dictyostelium) n=1 Tax=Desmophyllum pertusum TaxID=174260 RepID=A0A9W9ZIG3_9CNID|nr:SMEK 2, suppressor of mek1 (Dictyostelium) [Desmophyllum pertusum]